MAIEDPPLRNSVWNLDQAVKQKAAKKNRRPPPRPPRDPRSHYTGHSQETIDAHAARTRAIMGERD